MSSPQWTPAHFKQNGWSSERALAVAQRLEPEASEGLFLRASVSNPTKKVANKSVLKVLFTERKVPFDFDEFSANIASFIDDGDVTGGCCQLMTLLPTSNPCRRAENGQRALFVDTPCFLEEQRKCALSLCMIIMRCSPHLRNSKASRL
jgi:hypothetical protein